INLLLCNLLREAGIESDPILVSTRSYGKVDKRWPFKNQFNHVIVATRQSNPVFIDGISSNWANTLIGINTHGIHGLVLHQEDEDIWLNVRYNGENGLKSFTQIELTGNTANYEVDILIRGLSAGVIRSKYTREEFENFLFDDLNDSDLNIVESNISIEDFVNHSTELKIKLHATADIDNTYALITPFLLKELIKNPFSSSERTYPINFKYVPQATHTVVIDKNGFKVGESPGSKKFTLISKEGVLNTYFSKLGSKAHLKVDLDFEKKDFYSDEYEEIKNLFNHYEKVLSDPIIFVGE
ncbi:MAG: hypothetical protein R3345_05995, partial [Fulvivirga sp.]|nr:hypothetical protein [Fulvivirga sp.]